MTQKNQNSVANKEPNFIDPKSLAKVTFRLLVKFNIYLKKLKMQFKVAVFNFLGSIVDLNRRSKTNFHRLF
jgi:hypothetical protein